VFTGAARLLNVGLQPGVYHMLVGNASTVAPTEGTWAVNVFETTPARPTSGGPDVFGYFWTNSLNPSGPDYDWVEISGIGTPITLSSGSSYAGPFALGMDFPFYDAVYNQFYVSSEGFLSFNALTSSYSTNSTLPAAAAPNNIIAGFWDDLSYTTGVGQAFYYYDGANSRFILEFKDFYKSFTSTNLVTFQIILEQDGDIFIQIKNTPEAVINSATQGIEDGAGVRGLLVNYNNTGGGLYDGITTKITRPAGDVVPPSIAHTPLGLTEDTTNPYPVVADISDLDNAVASATLYYQVNGGGYNAVGMTAGTPPSYSAEIPAQAAGSTVQYYIEATDTASPANTGSSAVWTFDVVDYTLPPTGFTASDGVLDAVNLAWSPPAWVVALLGQPTPEPRFEDFLPLHSSKDAAWQAFQGARAAWLQDAQRAFVSYNIYRDGSLIGTSAGTTYTDDPPTTGTYTYHVTAQFTSRESDPSNSDTGFKSLRPTSGGPDGLGYTWVNSLDEDGPDYEWIDISGTGTALTLTDDSFSAALPLGFNFPFYGANKTSLYVSSNGHLTFGTGSSSLGNTNLPNTSTPNDLIAPFWDDMNPGLAGSTIHYLADGANNRFIVQYHVPAFGAVSPFTFFDFQAILTNDGNILIQFANVDEADVSQATLGIENSTGTVGLAANFDGTGGRLADGMAYLFLAPEGDWTGPSIVHTPLTNTEDTTNPYTVNADITDEDSAVASATLYYQVNGGGYTSVAMTAGTPPAYSADIPAQVGGSDIQYYIVAVDNSVNNNSTTSPTWSFSVVDYTLAPTALVATDGIYGEVRLTWTAPAWAVAFSSPEPAIDAFVPLYASKAEAEAAWQAAHAAWAQTAQRSFLSYNIYRDGNLVGTSAVTNYVDIPPVVEQVYTYHVTAQFDAGESAASNTDTGFYLARPTSGGPDTFGYTWMNSDDPSGAVTYSWTDISTDPNAVAVSPLGDDTFVAGIPMGIQFPFYGVDQDSINVAMNGFVNFGAGSGSLSNQDFPDALTPNNTIAMFWDDLDPGDGVGSIHTLSDPINGRFTVQYTNVPDFPGPGGAQNTFQLVLQNDGQILVYYNTILGDRTSATVGIENADATDALLVNYNDLGGRIGDELALRIRPLIPCGTPTNVDVAIASGNALVTWDAVDGALSYTVFAATEPYGTFNQIGTSATPSYTDMGAQAAGRKFYQIVAVCE